MWLCLCNACRQWMSRLNGFCDYCTCAAVTIAIVWVFRKYVSNNRIYFGANQHKKYPSCGLSWVLRITDDWPRVIDSKRRSLLPPSTLEVSFEIKVSYLMFYSIVIYFCSQLSYFVSNWSDERLREDLGRDKPRIFKILSIDLMSTRM